MRIGPADAFAQRIVELMDRVRGAIDPGLPTLVAFPEDVGLMLVLAGMHRQLLGVREDRRSDPKSGSLPVCTRSASPVEAPLRLGARPLSDKACPDRLDLL